MNHWTRLFAIFPALGLLALTTFALTDDPGGPAELRAPQSGLEEVPSDQVSLDGGFWGKRLEIHHETTIPHVLDMLEKHHHVRNFDIAAKVVKGGAVKDGDDQADASSQALQGDVGDGEKTGKDGKKVGIVGHSAFDSDLHKALEGASYLLGHFEDEALRKRIDGILDRIVAAQEENGYLVSYFTAKEPDQKWADMRTNHEMYNAGHFFEFAVEHYRQTGDKTALEAAKRFADHLDRTFGPGKRYEVDGHQGIELALVKLYRITGEKRYLDLCRFLVDERGHAHGSDRQPYEPGPQVVPERKPGQTDYEYGRAKWRARLYWRNGRMQDHKPLLEQSEAVGHAVRATYIYSAMTDLARFSEAPEYAKAVRVLWEDVIGRKMYLTGGLGTAQYGDEGFGDPYLLPNKTYCESCASIGHVFWQHRMTLLEREAKYADVMELTLYNSALSGLELSGDAFFYQNPLESKTGAQRRNWIGLACCPTNLARLTPQVSGLMYAKGDGRLDVNLFAAGKGMIDFEGKGKLGILQETNYPWDGKVTLKLTAAQPMEVDLGLRIPGWALGQPVPGDLYQEAVSLSRSVSLQLNGELVEATPGSDGYVRIKREWTGGEVLVLDLPMEVRRVVANEKLEEDRGKVALMRGPIVYCFEGVDQAEGVDLFKITLPRSASLETEDRPDFLNGMTVIKTTGRDAGGNPVKLLAIPYYAWANRGKSPMRIWLPEEASPGDGEEEKK